MRKCALDEYNDIWVSAGAIQTLKLIASTRSRKILAEIRVMNPNSTSIVESAITYIMKNPSPTSDQDLAKLGKRIAIAIEIGEWQKNEVPFYNTMMDKACIDMIFVEDRDEIVCTATFHKVDGIWKLRGVRETLQGLIAIAPE